MVSAVACASSALSRMSARVASYLRRCLAFIGKPRGSASEPYVLPERMVILIGSAPTLTRPCAYRDPSKWMDLEDMQTWRNRRKDRPKVDIRSVSPCPSLVHC